MWWLHSAENVRRIETLFCCRLLQESESDFGANGLFLAFKPWWDETPALMAAPADKTLAESRSFVGGHAAILKSSSTVFTHRFAVAGVCAWVCGTAPNVRRLPAAIRLLRPDYS